MSIVLSIQGCMAVGKTTALKYLQTNAPYVNVSFENNTDVTEQVKSRNLDKNVLQDYIEIQKLWIDKEIKRWELARKFKYSVMDFGAEEIEFYTHAYPMTLGVDWNIEEKLYNELKLLKKCIPDKLLFLDASEKTLRINKEQDSSCPRKSFEYYIEHLMPLKRKWFIGKNNVEILNIDNLSKGEVGEKVKEWVDNCIKELYYR